MGPDQRYADLSAMRVAGERKRHATWNFWKNIRLMGQEQHRIVGFDARQSARQIVDAAKFAMTEVIRKLIAQSRQPELLSGRTKHHGVVFEYRYAGAGQRAAHAMKVMPPIVIAKDRPGSERSIEPRQFAGPDRIDDWFGLEPVPRGEIAEQYDEVGLQAICGVDHLANMRQRHVWTAGM